MLQCKYHVLGCQWQGKGDVLKNHEGDCVVLTKPPTEMITYLQTKRESESGNSLISFVCNRSTQVISKY